MGSTQDKHLPQQAIHYNTITTPTCNKRATHMQDASTAHQQAMNMPPTHHGHTSRPTACNEHATNSQTCHHHASNMAPTYSHPDMPPTFNIQCTHHTCECIPRTGRHPAHHPPTTTIQWPQHATNTQQTRHQHADMERGGRAGEYGATKSMGHASPTCLAPPCQPCPLLPSPAPSLLLLYKPHPAPA